MTFPNPGPATQSTGNVAGGPYGAWSGTGTTALIGPAGLLVPFGQGAGPAIAAGANSITSGTAVFSNLNGVSFGINGQTLTASAAGGGVALYDGANSITSGTGQFSNANGVSFGFNGQTITASIAAIGGAQTGISSIADSANTQSVGMLSLANGNGVTFGLSTGVATATLTASVAAQSVQTQTAGNIAQTGFATTTTNGVVIVGTNQGGVTLAVPPYITTYVAQSVQTQAAGNIGGTGFATTTTNGVVIVGTLATNGETLAVPPYITTWTVPSTAGLLSAINVSGSNTSSNLSAVAFSNLNGVTFGLSTAAGLAGTITASVAAAGGAQTGISSIADNAGTQTVGMLSFANSNGLSFGLSTGALTATLTGSYTVPSTAGLISGMRLSAGAGTSNTAVTGLTFANSNGLTFGLSTGANVGTITASYTVPTQSAQTLSAIVSSNTVGNTSAMTVDARSISFQGYGIVSVGLSTTNTGSSFLFSATTTSTNPAFSAQGGSSSFQTLVFTNSNNVSFSNTGGSVWGSFALNVSANGGTSNALSGLSFVNSNNVSWGLSTGAGVGTITASVQQPTGITALNVSAGAGTSNALTGITFANSNNITFGLSTGASVGTMTASFSQSVQTQLSGNLGASTAGFYLQGNTSNSSSGTMAISSINLSGLGAITLATSASSIQFQVPQTSSLVGTSGMSVSTNASTISVFPIVFSTYVPQWPASTSSLLLNALGVSTANPVFFPFQLDWPVNFNMIAILESYSYITSAVGGSNTQGVLFGLFSNNASTWSQISSGSSSVAMSNNVLSQTISYATATSTSGYGYATTTFTGTNQAESFVGSVGFRNPIMQFAGNMTLTPGWYAIGLLSTASSAGANVGINQALIGNVAPISNMFGMGQSITVTNQMLGMGYGTATSTGLPVSMAFSNMTNSLGIIPIITLAST